MQNWVRRSIIQTTADIAYSLNEELQSISSTSFDVITLKTKENDPVPNIVAIF